MNVSGGRRIGLVWLTCLVIVGLSACAPRVLTFPTDPGAPLPGYADIHAVVSSACAGVRTLTAELSLSGRAGGERLRGRVHAGFERPSSMRLEAVVPFGPPLFILVAREGSGTLLLQRESRVVLGAPEEILGALTGVTLAPAGLQAVLTGCVVAAPQPTGGRLHAGNWASIDLEGDATLYLQHRRGRWELRGARRDGWHIEYADWQGALPRSVRLRSERQAVDVSAALAQLHVNTGIAAAAFSVEVPHDAFPLSVDELREAGPLREGE